MRLRRQVPPIPEFISTSIGDRVVEIPIRRSLRAKWVRIQISDRGPEIVLPKRANYKHAIEVVQNHELWLEKHLTKWSMRANESEVARSILVRGEPIRIVLVAEQRRGLLGTEEIVLQESKWKSQAQEVLKELARADLQSAIDCWSHQMNLFPKKVSLRDQKTKWGSCSARGSVTFNWRLVMAPPKVLEYVVIHELAHLQELNHSPRFWALVEEHCPLWKSHKIWLRQNGHLLHKI